MHYRYYTCDVFTRQPFSGNPLAVFPDAQGISDAAMQRIARELNLSETVFVLPAESDEHDVRVRIFTPGREMPFAGHPTLGTAWVLCHLGRHALSEGESTLVLGENVGPVPVTLRVEQGELESAELSVAQLPAFRPAPDAEALAAITGLAAADFAGGAYAPRFASCGAMFLIAVLNNVEALSRVRIQSGAFAELLGAAPSQDLWLAAANGDGRWQARMFAPLAGIPEDPATGSAAAAFAGFLAEAEPLAAGTQQWQIDQGIEMGRPSQLLVEVDRAEHQTRAVRVRGAAVMISDGQMMVAGAG